MTHEHIRTLFQKGWCVCRPALPCFALLRLALLCLALQGFVLLCLALLCRHGKKQREREGKREREKQTDRQRDRQTDRQTVRQTDRQINRQVLARFDDRTPLMGFSGFLAPIFGTSFGHLFLPSFCAHFCSCGLALARVFRRPLFAFFCGCLVLSVGFRCRCRLWPALVCRSLCACAPRCCRPVVNLLCSLGGCLRLGSGLGV